jgi:dTDP-4-dehydrorhamnose 3,5-epimerase
VADDWAQTPIEGVRRRSLPLNEDPRGSFREVWRDSWTRPLGVGSIAQANLSKSNAAVLRGLHFHLRQTDVWVILEGRAHVALVDLRARLAHPAASTATMSETLTANDAVLIPPGVAHGFWAVEPVTLLYLVTNEYDGSDEHGFRWDDPEAAAAWPGADPVLSVRDAEAPSLSDALAAAGH